MNKPKANFLSATVFLLAIASFFPPIEIEAQTVTGSGTANQVTKWTSASKLGNSAITETSGMVGIGTTAPARQLHIGDGSMRIDRSTDGTQFVLNRTGLKAFAFGVVASASNNGDFYLADPGQCDEWKRDPKIYDDERRKPGDWHEHAGKQAFCDGDDPVDYGRVHVPGWIGSNHRCRWRWQCAA